MSYAPLPYKRAKISASASGATPIVAAVPGKRIRVVSYLLSANADVNAKFQSASTDLTDWLYMGAKGGNGAAFSLAGHFETAAAEALNINLSGAVAVGGFLTYTEV